MAKGAKYAKRNNRMAPYFVQMREFERRLLKEALTAADGQIDSAATMLGVTRHYMLARAKFLGGVFTGESKHEPPGSASQAWNAANTIARNGVLLEQKGAKGAQAPACECSEIAEPDPWTMEAPPKVHA